MFFYDSPRFRIFLVMLVVAIHVGLSVFAIGTAIEGISFYDFAGQWKLTAYALQGIDPYPLIGADYAVIDSIGIIPKGWGTSPWGLLLGNIFYPGFMSMENAIRFFMAINIALIIITSLSAFFKFKKTSIHLGIYAFLCAIFSFWFMQSFTLGNAGAGICCLLLLVIFYYDTHPDLAGVLLGLSMIKPQTALIIYFVLLLMKKYRVVLISSAVVFLSLIIVSALIQTNPINLINEFLNVRIGNNESYSGIFTLMFINKPFLAMILSMLIGVLLTGFFYYLLPPNLYKTFCFYPVCLISTFWSYSFYNEFYILLLPLMICIYSILYVRNGFLSLCSFFAALYLSAGSFIVFHVPFLFFTFLQYFSFPVQSTNNVIIEKWVVRTLFEIGIIIIAFLMFFILKRILRDRQLFNDKVADKKLNPQWK